MPDDPEVSNASPVAPSRRRRAARRVVLVAGLVLVGLLAGLYTAQANIIFPGSSTQGRPEAVVRAGPGEELVKLPTPGGEAVALFGPALSADGRPLPDAEKRPALVFFYGNAMCLAHCRDLFDRFRRLGLNVAVPDYLGYGMSGGEPSEIGCRQAAEACHAFLRSRGFPAGRILVAGWSLGAAVAIDLAAREEVGGLIALSAFTSMRDMAGTVLPIAPPAFLFRDKFDSLTKIKTIKRPILLGHGRRDPIVPFAMLGRLAAACPRPPTTLVLDHAGHNDFLDQGGARLDRAIQDLAARAVEDSARP